jgi:serine O-acetyltransferase
MSFLSKAIFAFRALPTLVVHSLSSQREIVDGDIAYWRVRNRIESRGVRAFLALMTWPEFRSVINYRIPYSRLVSWLAGRGAPALYILTPNISPGFYISHGFATIVHCRSIGKNCAVSQQVTVGFNGYGADDCPIIGDNVNIKAGAKVVGKIEIGNNVTIGANAVVVKSVPDDCVVVGVPAYIVRRNGVSCREPL